MLHERLVVPLQSLVLVDARLFQIGHLQVIILAVLAFRFTVVEKRQQRSNVVSFGGGFGPSPTLLFGGLTGSKAEPPTDVWRASLLGFSERG